MRSHPRSAHGFSLVEVLVAASILAVALTSLAELFVLAARANAGARAATGVAVTAREKMEQLRALAWGVDALGLPVTDPGLRASPGSALSENVPGYCDFLDSRGRVLGAGGSPPAGTTLVRRWSVEPLPGLANETIVVQVLAGTWRAGVGGRPSLGDGVRLVTVRTRKAM